MKKLIRKIVTFWKIRSIKRRLYELRRQILNNEISYPEVLRQVEILEKELADLNK